jgi:putative sugar O-methyltransferase
MAMLTRAARRLSRLVRRKSEIFTLGSSLSDNQFYTQACLDAASNYARFNCFRRHPDYCQILEQLDHNWGLAYWKEIQAMPALAQHMELFRANDQVGGPLLHEFDGLGSFSPTTLRYVKILGDLQRLFGSLDGLYVHEIGVGYGGQCRVIQAAERLASYTLIDLQPALALAQRYLEHFPLAAPIHLVPMNELKPVSTDFVISNYAFSELRREVQDLYLQRVICKAARGYMILNQINPDDYNSYSIDELLAVIPGSRLVEEVPLTFPGNALLIWGFRPEAL